MMINETVKEMENVFSRYKNVIGFAVLIMLIVLSIIIASTYIQGKKISEDCGFENEKVHCVCTKQAWDEYSLSLDDDSLVPKGLNISEG